MSGGLGGGLERSEESGQLLGIDVADQLTTMLSSVVGHVKHPDNADH